MICGNHKIHIGSPKGSIDLKIDGRKFTILISMQFRQMLSDIQPGDTKHDTA